MTHQIAALALMFAAALAAQEVGPSRGENAGNYNITNSWETGYRFVTVGGDRGKYRSDLNYGNGIRLLSGSFTANSKDGHGTWFDSLSLTTEGLGNDPYEAATLRAEKNRWFEYSLGWRQNRYFNPDLVLSGGEHVQDLVHRWQDHDLVIFPQRRYRIRAGFSDVNQRGPALTTLQLFNDTGNEFPVFSDVRRRFYEYRLGVDLDIGSWHVSVLRRWEDFREDTPDSVDAFEPGNDPLSSVHLTSFQRSEPDHGTTSGWMANLNTTERRYAVNAHFTYSGGRRNFLLDEFALGPDRLTAAHQRETFAAGDARRPVITGDLTATLMATARLTIVNSSSVRNVRIDGNSVLDQFDNSSLTSNLIFFQFLGIRTISNATDLQYRVNDRWSAYAGYQYSTRTIRSIEDLSLPGTAGPVLSDIGRQSNHLNTAIAGANWLITKRLRLRLQGELGRNNQPFFPIAERKYHAIDARLDLRARNLQASAGYRQFYNNNSISVTAYSSRSRTSFANVSWTATPRLNLDLNYNKIHQDSLGGLAFFAGNPADLAQGESFYVSNLHSGSAALHWALTKRADLLLGYTVARDTGDSRSNPALGDPITTLLSSVRAFPLSFQSPYARISVRLSSKLRWNWSYRYYGYREDVHLFGLDQGYRAHTGTVSLLWAF